MTSPQQVHVLEDRLKMVHQTKTFAEKIQKNWSEVEILNVRKEVNNNGYLIKELLISRATVTITLIIEAIMDDNWSLEQPLP